MADPGRPAPAPWPRVAPALVAGVVAVVAGGLTAAASRPLSWAQGGWVAAFLVLVLGVGQITLACGQALGPGDGPSTGRARAGFALWNVGGVGVVAGTLASAPIVVAVASVPLVVVLVACLRDRPARAPAPRWFGRAHGVVALVLLAGVPVGVVLAWR